MLRIRIKHRNILDDRATTKITYLNYKNEDKYMDPGQLSLFQKKEKKFWSKKIFEPKTNKKNA